MIIISAWVGNSSGEITGSMKPAKKSTFCRVDKKGSGWKVWGWKFQFVISFNPWQAHIHFDPIGPVCGGAILDEETILTSVFCVVRPFSNPPQVGFFLWNWLIHLTHFVSADFSWDYSRVVLLRQLWIVNYSIKSLSNNLSNEYINIGVFLVFKAKRV